MSDTDKFVRVYVGRRNIKRPAVASTSIPKPSEKADVEKVSPEKDIKPPMSDTDQAVRNFIAKGGGVKKVPMGVGANLGPKHWDAIVESSEKVDVRSFAAEKGIKPLANKYERDKGVDYETKVKVRDIKTGEKGSFRVQTRIGCNRFSRDERADVANPKLQHALPMKAHRIPQPERRYQTVSATHEPPNPVTPDLYIPGTHSES